MLLHTHKIKFDRAEQFMSSMWNSSGLLTTVVKSS